MDFSQQALQKLLQLFPELANFIVTFRDITDTTQKGEDSDLSVGVFILQLGGGYFYIPVLYKGDAVQPIDSIFNAEDGTFSPLTKSFVQQAVNSSQLSLGKSKKIPATVNKNPSVYEMVTPPRTGKFVYASSSRLTEFLALMPNMVKKAMLDKFSEDREVYNALHKLFGLENLLAALRPTAPAVKVTPKPAVEVITEGEGLPQDEVKSILEKGYVLRGENPTNRVAVLANDFDEIGRLKQVGSSDAGLDYDIVTKTGEVISAYIPKRSIASPQFAALLCPYKGGDPVFAIYETGDYSISPNMVARGEGRGEKKVVTSLFKTVPPSTPREVVQGDTIAVFSPELDLVGAYSVFSVSQSNVGVSIQARNLIRSGGRDSEYNLGRHSGSPDVVTINATRNCVKVNVAGNVLFVPYNSLVVKLRRNICYDLETNVNSAFAKLELSTLTALGSAANIGFDGYEFSYNGRPVGSEVKMIELLVVKEGVAPEKAESFIKQAKVSKHVKVYMSKVADFEPGEVPQYGDRAPDGGSMWDFDKGDDLLPRLKNSLQTQDPQTVESVIISELIQVSNMKEYVREYLPEIKETLNKLGRTLFLARLNASELSKTRSAMEISSFISNLRNVYRMLGENYVKLEQMVEDSEKPDTE